MSFFTNLKRASTTTKKQIARGGWLSMASVSIMSLAFLVLTIFGVLAFVSQLFLKSLENSPHIYVFFNVDVEEQDILDKKIEWEKNKNIDFVDYTSAEQAKQEFARHNEVNDNPLIAAEIQDEDRTLPASLAVRLVSIEDAQDVIDMVENEKDTNPDVYDVRYSQETINNIKDVVFWLRLYGSIVLILLVIVVIFFTLLTVEFRTYSRSKEIEIMQLVGGSLWYIRLPFILEGGVYGALGALISNMLIILFGSFAWYSQATSTTKSFLLKMFGDLPWPEINIAGFVLIFLSVIMIGFLIGSMNSLVAIRRYIK